MHDDLNSLDTSMSGLCLLNSSVSLLCIPAGTHADTALQRCQIRDAFAPLYGKVNLLATALRANLDPQVVNMF